MLGLSRKRLNLFLLLFVSIVGFGLLLVSRFNATDVTPASKAVQGSSGEVRAEALQPTDKTELAQTDLMEVKPSPAVMSAERALPQQGAPGYINACQKMKAIYTNERNNHLQAEANRFAAALQEIINKYHREGKSFSPAEKFAHARETHRHEAFLGQINDQHHKQLKNLNC